jgi:hypothetical protein
VSDENYFRAEGPVVTPERWQHWKAGFRDAAGEEGGSEERKDVAMRAFKLMEALEMCMPP